LSAVSTTGSRTLHTAPREPIVRNPINITGHCAVTKHRP